MAFSLSGVSHDYGSDRILESIAASAANGERIGLIGPNGCGKTTLLRIICGEIEPVAGSVVRDPGTRFAYVPQHLDEPPGTTAGEYLFAHLVPFREALAALETEMAGCDPDDEARLGGLLRRYESARESYDSERGDHAEDDARRVLEQVGLSCGIEQEIDSLSGGERNTLSLARALMRQPDVLVLDEPGNHLDFAGLAWLESFLADFSGTVIVVSHNRYLLDRVVTRIWEIFGGRLTEYAGGYSDYRFERLQKALSDQALWSVQQRTIRRLEQLVKTFEQRARATADPAWGKRLRSRRTQLEKTKERALERPEVEERTIDVTFSRETSQSDIAVDVNGYGRTIGGRVLFEETSLVVHVGERVGIIGPNGCGKTTFLHDLVTGGDWNRHDLRIGPSMRVGYCAQERGRYAKRSTVMDALLTHGNFSRKELFAPLASLLFSWEDLDRSVDSLSGGEWNRLQLAAAILTKANLLILDEPTNHLDIPSREAVEEAIADFEGTVMTVSHDRYFLDAVVSRIVVVEDRSLRSFTGSFTEFWFARSGTRIRNAAISRRAKQTGKAARTRPADRDDRKTEQQIMDLEAQKVRLEEEMTRAFGAKDYHSGRGIARDIERIQKRLDDLYERWGAEA